MKRFLLFSLLLILSGFVFASSAKNIKDETNNITALNQLLGTIKTFQADFSQTVFDNRGKALQKSFGLMKLKRPNQFRWEVTSPIPQLIIANDKKVWIYDKDLEQVTIKKVDFSDGGAPALLLSHDQMVLAKDYTVSATLKADSQSFILRPKKKDNMFSEVEMRFQNGVLMSMQLKDHLGHLTSVTYQNIKMNEPLNLSLFNFSAPKNTDVIDETKS